MTTADPMAKRRAAARANLQTARTQLGKQRALAQHAKELGYSPDAAATATKRSHMQILEMALRDIKDGQSMYLTELNRRDAMFEKVMDVLEQAVVKEQTPVRGRGKKKPLRQDVPQVEFEDEYEEEMDDPIEFSAENFPEYEPYEDEVADYEDGLDDSASAVGENPPSVQRRAPTKNTKAIKNRPPRYKGRIPERKQNAPASETNSLVG